ncbi:MAG: IS5 family transposase [Proteobacteria bacterium]|nr:IS5 family transposase [Pseudomonadota bacterium]
MKQTDLGLDLTTRKGKVVGEMNRVVPWSALLALIEPHAPRQDRGRPPFGIEAMLRIHFLQHWFGLSDVAMEEALFDVPLYRQFAGLGGMNRLPDRVSILRFRHLLEQHELAPKMLEAFNATRTAKGLIRKEGTAIDATLIAAPSSTKNGTGTRDPEMHQAKKGNQWHFGLKAHIGVDADSDLVHTVVGTAAHVSDRTQAHALVHGEESDASADPGYQGVEKREDTQAIETEWHVTTRLGKRRALDKSKPAAALIDRIEQAKARIRAKVERPFRVVKRQFGHVKVRDRRLAKNAAQLHMLFALSNLWMARHRTIGAMG